MAIYQGILDTYDEMTDWRRELYRHPELGFQENWISDFVARKLESFGVAIPRGFAKTSVVATLEQGEWPSIGLSAYLDGATH